MGLTIRSSPEEIKFQFASLRHARDVANLLEVEYSLLVYHLHKTPILFRYKTFALAKKSGGFRQICVPVTALKIIQAKLNYVLKEIYVPKPYVYGFVRKGGIVKNAECHADTNFILNVDLENFFPSIHFGRVKGMFAARPYNCNAEVATVLAQICCLPAEYPSGPPFAALPQGAPSSPVVSNMVCAKLDSQLRQLAKKYRCSYSRYADDLTFSTTLNKFPDALAKVVINEVGGRKSILGDELRDIILSNRFRINDEKVRLQHSSERQVVTGLTANEFPNVPRKYVRQTRAMLHAWKKYGYENASKEFLDKYCDRSRKLGKHLPQFKDVVRGKIEYIGMVRGKTDPLYLYYLRKLRALAPELVKKNYIDLMDALWVLECEDSLTQGTAFMLRGYGLVTCYHVLCPATRAFRADKPTKRYNIEVIAGNPELDIALLKIDGPGGPELLPEEGELPRPDDWIKLAGYPSYSAHTTGVIRRGRVTGYWRLFDKERMFIDAPIVFGNSGGPVLNSKDKVVGIAAKGTSSLEEAHKTDKYEVIPITALRPYCSAPLKSSHLG